MSDTTSNATAPTEVMIRIADIEVGDRIRKLANMKLAKMEEIAASIVKIGLVQAITVSKHPTKEGIYILQAGMYRLEAYKHLGRAEIRARVSELTGDLLALVQTDENLMRADLDDMERADFMAARKAIYERLHPETKQGNAQGGGKKRSIAKSQVASERQIGVEISTEDLPKQQSFVADTADKTDRSKTSIGRDLDRSKKIEEEVKTKIKGTWIAKKGTLLDEIKELAPELQLRRVEELLKAGPPKKRNRSSSGPTGKPVPKSSAPLEHHGDGTSQHRDLAKKLDPLFDALWLISADARDNASKIENALAECNVIAVSDRKRDPRKHLRDLQEKAPKKRNPEKVAANAWLDMKNAWLTMNSTAQNAFVEVSFKANDDLLPELYLRCAKLQNARAREVGEPEEEVEACTDLEGLEATSKPQAANGATEPAPTEAVEVGGLRRPGADA